MKLRSLVTSLIAIGLVASTMLAQTFYGSIVGTVTDTSGAAVPGAKVILSSTGTADRRTAESDSSGTYQFLHLVPGVYQIAIEASGFKRIERTAIQVQVAGAARVDAKLEVGDITQTV